MSLKQVKYKFNGLNNHNSMRFIIDQQENYRHGTIIIGQKVRTTTIEHKRNKKEDWSEQSPNRKFFFIEEFLSRKN